MKKKMSELLSEFFLKGWSVDPGLEAEIELRDAGEFFSAKRIDLVCKLIYIESRENGKCMEFAKELYREHIRAFSQGTFTEPGTEEKNSLEKYFSSFDLLIDDIKKNGINPEISAVPIGDDGVILDGSHRTAIAIYYNLKLPVFHVPGISKNYNYEFFSERGLDERYLDYMAREYIRYAKRPYVLCLWPRASGEDKIKAAEGMIRETAELVYNKKCTLGKRGLRQLMIHIYGDQPWAGTIENGYSGIPLKSDACFSPGRATNVYLLEGPSLEEMVRLKSDIRDIFKVENHSVHITDTKTEAVQAADILFNSVSLDLMNYGDITAYPETARILNSRCDDVMTVSAELTKILYGISDMSDTDGVSLIKSGKGLVEGAITEPLKYGAVYASRFEELTPGVMSFSERLRYRSRTVKNGVFFNRIASFGIYGRIRHLGGNILRRLGLRK